MASEEVGAQCRAAACLCVLCGLPAAGKSTLAGEVLRTAALAGWRFVVVPYDDLIPDHAFQTKEMDDVKLQESVIPLRPFFQLVTHKVAFMAVSPFRKMQLQFCHLTFSFLAQQMEVTQASSVAVHRELFGQNCAGSDAKQLPDQQGCVGTVHSSPATTRSIRCSP